MKKILITGANSYIGTSVEKWLMKEPDKYQVITLDMQRPNWKEFDFSGFDVVFHVAGIAHASNNKKMEKLYYKINTGLTIEVAQKSKVDGVKQFIFMSSKIVYNSSETVINANTITNPNNSYGRSKLEAENGILELLDSNFNVAILRSPMIYGPNSKGNFPRLYRFAQKTLVFPKLNNQRSILFIDNLTEFVTNTIQYNLSGIYFPQNKQIISTSEIVSKINILKKRKVVMTSLFNPVLRILSKKISVFNKLFSDSYYEPEMSKYDFDYHVASFDESIIIIGNFYE